MPPNWSAWCATGTTTTTRRMLEGILSQEQEHAEELGDWLQDQRQHAS